MLTVRWHAQYRGDPSGKAITGYRVYAYDSHPLYPMKGLEFWVKTSGQASRFATQLRKYLNHNGPKPTLPAGARSL